MHKETAKDKNNHNKHFESNNTKLTIFKIHENINQSLFNCHDKNLYDANLNVC